MSKVNTIKRVLREGPKSVFRASFDHLRALKIMRLLSDEQSLKLIYYIHFGRKLNLENPRSFNEKLQWLKLYNRQEKQTLMVDKYLAKEYVGKIIGEDYIIKNLGVWQSADSIDFTSLPDGFVLKCNHDSGSVFVCKDKRNFNLDAAQKRLKKSLQNNLYWWGREWPYKNVKPLVFAEELLEDKEDGDLKDYKFFCFNGKVRCFKVDFGRFTDHHANYYSPSGVLLEIGEALCPPEPSHRITLPDNLDEMVRLAEILSKDEPFLRVDFYDVNGKIYFGELTFYPASGLSPFIDFKSDIEMGEWLELPKK